VASAFSAIDNQFATSTYAIRAAVFNAGDDVWKPFLDTSYDDFRRMIDSRVGAAWSFSREVILRMQKNELSDGSEEGVGKGKRGTIIFTGATASIRGNTTSSAISAAKHGVRALSQSLAKEFGQQNIHVSHAIIDGMILTDRAANYMDEGLAADVNKRLNAESIARSYLYLSGQDSSAFTWELDLRPAHEKW